MSIDPLQSADPLSSLRGIALPEHPISYFPLAPGFWVLIAFFIALLLLLFARRHRIKAAFARKKEQRFAIRLLEAQYSECAACRPREISCQNYLQNSNVIFKRIVNSQPELSSNATLSGELWVSFLETIYKKVQPRIRFSKKQRESNKNFCRHYGKTLYAARCDENIPLSELHAFCCRLTKGFYAYAKKLKGNK